MSDKAHIKIRHANGSNCKTVPAGMPIIEYVKQLYPKKHPDALPYYGLETSVHLKNRSVPLNENSDDFDRVLRRGDFLEFRHTPEGLDPLTAAIIVAVTAVAVVALTPTPQIPNDQGHQKSSPNNSLTGQTNLARPYEAIPEIFGRGLWFPDLIQPAVFEYVNDIKVVDEVFCLGRGTFEHIQAFSDKDVLTEIPGSSFEKFEPGTPPNDLMIARQSTTVDNVELKAPNDVTVQADGRIEFERVEDNTDPDNPVITHFIWFDNPDVVERLQLDTTGNFDVTGTAAEDGRYVFTSFDVMDHVFGSGQAVSSTRFTIQGSFNSVASQEAGIRRTDVDPELWQGWFSVPRSSEQVWCHFQWPRGSRTESGNNITTVWQIAIREVGTTGDGFVGDYSRTLNTVDPKFFTVKLTEESDGIPIDKEKEYEIRVRRSSDIHDGSGSLDQLRWESFFGIESYSGSRFGDVTIYRVTTIANEFAASQSNRRFNVDAIRMLPSWDEDTGYSPMLRSTERFSDAVLFNLHVRAGVPLDEINLSDLYEIDGRLGDLGLISYSFDDVDISLGQRVETICNVARVGVYRQGQNWEFFRDEPRPVEYMFNRRTLMKGNNQKLSERYQMPSDYDSVNLTYVDPETNTREEVQIRIDLETESIIEGEIGANPQEIDLAGCRNVMQARDRAHLEIRKILYGRRTVEDRSTYTGPGIGKGARVKYIDIYDNEVSDGEIMSINGNVYTTSERIEFRDGVDFYVQATDVEGRTSELIRAMPVDGNDQAFTADFGDFPVYVADRINHQQGSIYFIGSDDDQGDSDYSIATLAPQTSSDTEMPSMQIRLVQYDERFFEMDGKLV